MAEPVGRLEDLSPAERELLTLFLLGLSTRQLRIKLGMTIGRLQTLRNQLYVQLGVFEFAKQSRVVAVSVAVWRYGLGPPPYLEAAVEWMKSAHLDDESAAVLELLLCGSSTTQICDVLRMSREQVLTVYDRLLLGAGIPRAPHLVLPVIGLWAGRLTADQLSRAYQFSANDAKLVQLLLAHGDVDLIAKALSIRPSAAKGRLNALMQRLGVHSREELVARVVDAGWLTLEQCPEMAGPVASIKEAGLRPLDLRVVALLAQGLSVDAMRLAIGDADIQYPEAIYGRLIKRFGLSGPPALIACVKWAGEPERPQIDPMAITDEDVQILQWLLADRSGQEIADLLEVTKPASDNRIRQLYSKLGASNAEHAVSLAIKRRIIAAPECDETVAAELKRLCGLPLRLRLLNVRARGWALADQLVYLGAKSGTSFRRRLAFEGPAPALPEITVIGLLTSSGVIDPEAPLPNITTASVPEPREPSLMTQLTREVANSQKHHLVVKGTQALSPEADRLIAQHHQAVAMLQVPTASSRLSDHLARLRIRGMSDDVLLRLGVVLNSASLEAAASELGLGLPEFLRQAQSICRVFRTQDVRTAAVLARWAGRI